MSSLSRRAPTVSRIEKKKGHVIVVFVFFAAGARIGKKAGLETLPWFRLAGFYNLASQTPFSCHFYPQKQHT